MNPFRYPEARHSRSQTPGPFSDYRRYKPFLRKEFSRQCIYCRMPDGVCGPEAFGVEHYRPTSRFPSLRSEYANLFYSCNICNRLKGDFWPTEEQWEQGLFLPNPCDHAMSEHLHYAGARVLAASRAGSLTIDLLRLNDEPAVEYREFLLRSIERCLMEEQAILETLLDLEIRLPKDHGEQLEELRRDILGLRVDLAAVQADLERLTARTELSPPPPGSR